MFKLTDMDRGCIDQKLFIHILLENIDEQQLLRHCGTFVSFYLNRNGDYYEQCFEMQLSMIRSEITSLKAYVASFESASLTKVCICNKTAVVSINHGIADGTLVRTFINTLRSGHTLVPFSGSKSPLTEFSLDFPFSMPKENRLQYRSKGGAMRSFPFRAFTSMHRLNERVALAASLAVQLHNNIGSNTIGVGSCVDMRRFGCYAEQLCFFSVQTAGCEAYDEEKVDDVLRQLRFEPDLKKCLMYYKALQLNNDEYFSDKTSCRVEISNVGRLLEGEIMVSANPAFNTVTMSFYTVGEEIRGNLATGLQMSDIEAEKFVQIVLNVVEKTKQESNLTLGELRTLVQ